MPSKYQPQILGWIGDLDKGGNYLTGADQRLLYANDNYCAFIRKKLSDQIFYTSIFLVVFFLSLIVIYMFFLLIFGLDPKKQNLIFIIVIIGLLTSLFTLYISIPEIYQNLFTRRGSPIIFNRKTGKVYVNESYFFNFKVLRNPLTFFHPSKKRIKEYDWAYLQGVVVHNYSRYSLNSTILMVCKPNTNKTIDHIMLDPLRNGIGSYQVWGWVNNFMCANDLISLNDGKYKWEQETQFKKEIIEGQGWPEWMVEAFNATTHEELADIKQKYNVES
ncbi:hypothetical protein J3U08_11330 [Gilliamella sp. B2894]|uniref:DUF6708 domain-containing protein n=1 Tax=unclassified Gilliamella TaxID=2685620 RepID=UPI00226A3886|nr:MULTISPECIES: DUF6708 domain-containing protein [unclassified Gilliamella]MCX8657383.1 hypothetical protein [Gilliamella sp. B2894]MCX8697226.1 hypothetical protein [Gilliamella sp. B2828]